jgi:hypothetical protein
MAYVGNPIDTQNTFQSLVGKRFNGDGSTTDFTLDVAPGNVLDIEVFVGNVRQDPNSAYTVSGTTLSFTGAPPSGTNNIYVVHQAKSVGTIDVPTGGVAAGSLATSVLTGQTDIGAAIADADLFLIDDGAGGTLRKTAASRIKTYIGSPDDNEPLFHATLGSDTTVSHDTLTTIPANNTTFNLGSAYDTSTYKFTPQTAGKYYMYAYAQCNMSAGEANNCITYLVKNSTTIISAESIFYDNSATRLSATAVAIIDLNGSSDFVQAKVLPARGSGTITLKSDSDTKTNFGGFKLIT